MLKVKDIVSQFADGFFGHIENHCRTPSAIIKGLCSYFAHSGFRISDFDPIQLKSE